METPLLDDGQDGRGEYESGNVILSIFSSVVTLLRTLDVFLHVIGRYGFLLLSVIRFEDVLCTSLVLNVGVVGKLGDALTFPNNPLSLFIPGNCGLFFPSASFGILIVVWIISSGGKMYLVQVNA